MPGFSDLSRLMSSWTEVSGWPAVDMLRVTELELAGEILVTITCRLWMDYTQNSGDMHLRDATEALNYTSMIDRPTLLIVSSF